MTIEKQSTIVGFGYAEYPTKKAKVVGALIDMNNPFFFQHMGEKTERGVSSEDITEYINNKYSRIIRINKKSIDRRYKMGLFSLSDKLLSEKEVESTHGIDLRTVQRILNILKKQGYVKENKKRYTPSKKLLKLTHHSPFHFSEEILTAIMKLHTPSQDIKKNLSDLITLFGTYVIACLLEISRPIENFYFTNKKLKPLTIEEKNEFLEFCLENIIDTKLMYAYFLETFFNQLGKEYERNLRDVRCSDKRKNESDLTNKNRFYIKNKQVTNKAISSSYSLSTRFKTNIESYYELDNQSFEMVRETLAEVNPEIARQLNSVISWTEKYGEKANILYSWMSKNK